MGKTAKKTKERVSQYLREFPNETFRSDGDILYCTCCDKAVSTSQRFQVTQHIRTVSHNSNKERKSKVKQSFITPSTSSEKSKSTFNTDLCRAFVQADIPLSKVNNPSLKCFLEKYIEKKIPDESTLRKNYLHDIYQETITKIRENINVGPIWVSVDETTDVEGRYIANIIVGSLCPDAPSKPFLLNCQELEKCNHATIARFFNDSMSLLWPNGVLHEKVLLFLSDGAPYMIKAGKHLRVFFPKMIHLTCLAHAFHRVAESVRSAFPEVDSLISSVKKIFLKAPSRVQIFKENYPELPLPPQPIITRWGTWLEAALYYSKNLGKIEDVISKLDCESAAAIFQAQNLLENPNLKNNLAFISCNCAHIASTITHLESQNVPLFKNIQLVNEAIHKMDDISGEIGNKIQTKLHDVFKKNPGWKDLLLIADIIGGKEITAQLSIDWDSSEIAAFRYAPVTSVDVERSFSRFKSILRPNRRSLTLENLKMHLIPNCFPYED